MNQLSDEKLDKISGGSDSITGTVLSSIVKLIELLENAGYKLGSGIRRLAEDDVCPLE